MFLPERSDDEEWLGVVIAVPEPWVSQITDARLALGDPLGARVPAHITLMPPRAVPKDHTEQVVKHLRHLAAGRQPFRVTLRGSGTFMPLSPVVFLNLVEGGPECTDLAEDLRSGPLDYTPRFPYHPHVTLAQGLPEAELARAERAGKDFHASWMVPGFRLDRVDQDGNYTSAALFNFTGAGAGPDW